MSSPLKDPGESVRQKLKKLAAQNQRPFDEILRYFAMERFLYRLSISRYRDRFFLKGGLLLKIWDAQQSRATMDIDLLARTSNKTDHLRHVIAEVAELPVQEDAVLFQTSNLILRTIQIAADYQGIRASFSAELFTTKIPVLIDIGFNDIIIPEPQLIHYPTLLTMPAPTLLGYTLETVIAEKLETAVKRGSMNTRMKDFYDLWVLCRKMDLKSEKLKEAIEKVFTHRGTKREIPAVFAKRYYETPEATRRWETFLSTMGKKDLVFGRVMQELSSFLTPFLNR